MQTIPAPPPIDARAPAAPDFKHMPVRGPQAATAGTRCSAWQPLPAVAQAHWAAAAPEQQGALAVAGFMALLYRYTDQALLQVAVHHEAAGGRWRIADIGHDPQLGFQAAVDAAAQALADAPEGDATRLPLRVVLGAQAQQPLPEGTDLQLDIRLSHPLVQGRWRARADLFDPPDLDALAAQWTHLLQQAGAAPLAPLCSFDVLTPAQREPMEQRWTAAQQHFDAPERVHDIFARQTARQPDAPAAVFEGETITYGQLHRRVLSLADALRARGVATGEIVGVHMNPSIDLVVALLGVLQAGCAFVPLDPAYPPTRIAHMVRDSGARLVLCDGLGSGDGEDPLAGVSTLVPAMLAAEPASPAPPTPDLWVDASDPDPLMYVMYTSGSTGQPKGAMLTHRGIRNRLLWGIGEYRLGAAHAVLFKTSISFDVCIWEIFAPLLSGARLVIARRDGNRDADYLIGLMRSQAVTHADFVPSMLELFLACLDGGGLPALELITCAGEPLTHALLGEVFRQLPGVVVYNLYGPTEASLAVTHWHCRGLPADPLVPIGQAMANVRLYVLDRHGRLAAPGVAGEIFIGGIAPGRGYWRLPERTSEAFLPDPFAAPGATMYRTGDLGRMLADGTLYFLGRIDQQVKIRGYRIEPGEVEAQLASHPLVRSCAVLAQTVGPGDRRLVAWVTLKEPRGEGVATELRQYAAARLPHFMVPSLIRILDHLPLTPNGKADRQALAALPLHAAPAGDVADGEGGLAETIAATFRTVLRLPAAGVDADFFDLGGNSLLAVRAVIELREAGVLLEIGQIFEHRTPRALSRAAAASA